MAVKYIDSLKRAKEIAENVCQNRDAKILTPDDSLYDNLDGIYTPENCVQLLINHYGGELIIIDVDVKAYESVKGYAEDAEHLLINNVTTNEFKYTVSLFVLFTKEEALTVFELAKTSQVAHLTYKGQKLYSIYNQLKRRERVEMYIDQFLADALSNKVFAFDNVNHSVNEDVRKKVNAKIIAINKTITDELKRITLK